jgi:hypothetical protein
MMRPVFTNIWHRYQRSIVSDLVPAVVVMCLGLWLAALVMKI